MAAVRWKSLFLVMSLFLFLHYLSFLLINNFEKGERFFIQWSSLLKTYLILYRPHPDSSSQEQWQSVHLQLLSRFNRLFVARICPPLHQLLLLLPEQLLEGEKLPWKATRNQGGGKLYFLASRKEPLWARLGPWAFFGIPCSQPWLWSKSQGTKVVDFQGGEQQLCEVPSAWEEGEKVEERDWSRAGSPPRHNCDKHQRRREICPPPSGHLFIYNYFKWYHSSLYED